MPFPFTFNLAVPGLSNPFAGTSTSGQAPPTSVDRPGKKLKQKITRQRPTPGSSPSPAPLTRKRGWEPTFAEPSQSTATLTSTSARGYLDTPAKYRDMAEARADEFHEVEMFASDTEVPPPAKRRRGLAGSIVSTALSAALIGTAVGLTVYRLWRDRGKEAPRLEDHHQQPPPPPYQQGEWTPASPIPPSTKLTPATPRSRKSRHPVSATKRSVAQRRPRARTHVHTTPPRIAPPPALLPPTQPEFDFHHQEPVEPAEVDDQMDWIGDKLSMLIEEGKRALNREIVVMSDSKEDEFDDGSGAWEEDHPSAPSTSLSRSSSLRRIKRPRSLAPSAHAFHHSPSPSPSKPAFALTSSVSTPLMVTPRRAHSRGVSVESGFNLTPSTSFQEDERAWESPELRESMERARARFQRTLGPGSSLGVIITPAITTRPPRLASYEALTACARAADDPREDPNLSERASHVAANGMAQGHLGEQIKLGGSMWPCTQDVPLHPRDRRNTRERIRIHIHLLDRLSVKAAALAEMTQLFSLPPEILNEVLGHINEPPDLLSFGLASQTCARLVIPTHVQYRVIRIRTPFPDLWAHLARRPDLAGNIREVHLCARDDFCSPDRFPHTLIDPVIDGTEEHAHATGRARNMINALKSIQRLKSFAWDHEVDWKAGLAVDHSLEDAILRVAAQAPSLEHLALTGQCAAHVVDGMGVHRIAYPAWQITGLTSLSLFGGGWANRSNAHFVISMLQKSPNIEDLQVPMESQGLELCYFPRLKRLRFTLVTGVSTTGRNPDDAIVKFLEKHPTLEELNWHPIRSVDFSRHALPLLKRLKGPLHLVEALEDTDVVRQIEDLTIFPWAFDVEDVVCLNNINPSSLRRLYTGIRDLASLYAIAERFTGITWLCLPATDGMFKIYVDDWLQLLPRFQNLEVFRGRGLWSAVEYSKDRMHEVIGELIGRLPNLRELDHSEYYEKRRAYKVIKIFREEMEGGVLRVRYEVHKPPPR
ncbi:hypothetical protein DXG03_001013 [Asterophora parasitica]|uniref:F-box domain-containing protein n=1 Tax=Asterophora parasitica TaxID=117018 RepID=A0A9P7KC01_9AGAR|nr:hypothetical protein DXG03_001013 [Asterophora parasitica]